MTCVTPSRSAASDGSSSSAARLDFFDGEVSHICILAASLENAGDSLHVHPGAS